MFDCKPCSTPVDTQAKLFEDDSPPVTDTTSYRSLTSALQYLTFSKPDIAYAVPAYAHSAGAPSQADPTLPPRLP